MFKLITLISNYRVGYNSIYLRSFLESIILVIANALYRFTLDANHEGFLVHILENICHIYLLYFIQLRTGVSGDADLSDDEAELQSESDPTGEIFISRSSSGLHIPTSIGIL